jgi:hypothetical protein
MRDIAYLVGAIAALLTALGIIGRYMVKAFVSLRKMFNMVDIIETIVSQELTHNHGSSMKDDLYGMAVAFGLTQRQVDDMEEILYDHVKRFNQHVKDTPND